MADKGETLDDIYELVECITLMWGSPRIGVNGDLYLPLRRYGTWYAQGIIHDMKNITTWYALEMQCVKTAC